MWWCYVCVRDGRFSRIAPKITVCSSVHVSELIVNCDCEVHFRKRLCCCLLSPGWYIYVSSIVSSRVLSTYTVTTRYIRNGRNRRATTINVFLFVYGSQVPIFILFYPIQNFGHYAFAYFVSLMMCWKKIKDLNYKRKWTFNSGVSITYSKYLNSF